MALNMVHLAVADLWAEGHSRYRDDPQFYLGAISPDAIHIRDHDDKSHKDEIHLFNWKFAQPEKVVDYWLKHRNAFDIGYGVHVLTDGQWVPRYRERKPQLITPDGKPIPDLYYNDTFVTDFELLRDLPRLREILDMLEQAEAPADHPLLTQYELDEWRKKTLDFYKGECPFRNPARYIDRPYVDEFIVDCQPLLEATYRRAFPDDAENKE